jgi:hypothetical protein
LPLDVEAVSATTDGVNYRGRHEIA